MLASLVRRATASSMPLPSSVTDASVQLIPPIPLYRRLLRVHRSLPPEMRYLGDSYIKTEFRLTRSTDNPLHIIGFLSQWKHYLDDLETAAQKKEGGEIKWSGRRLDTDNLDKMSPEQVGQLYELMHATKDVWKT
ncbi:hypothetical protein BCR39DRAFT_565415 [Naematelia encephala]|uniref:Succinate dehydrogenase assembly factor 3 n=1 Tax=Naematelia encephala TaxID=71784 RepID=A0A1Y2B098_9TREE|nr:hypothetical protein BCR39DRAFT_565415 [Naematelia encephala]